MLSIRKVMDVNKGPAFREGHAAPLIQVLTWLFLSFSILSVVAHFATKKALSRVLTKADFILLASLILSIGQAVTFLCPAGQFIGNSQLGLPRDTVLQAWMALYSGEILFVLTLVFAKGSLLLPFRTVTPVVKHRRMMNAACAITLVWGVSAVFLIAFQCPSPYRWEITDPRCADIRAVRTYNAIMSIFIDLALAIVPTLMVLPLQIDSDRRITLLTGFWSRIIVVAASAIQISYLQRLSLTNDLLNSIWPVVVCGQVVQVTSIMTSTIPFLKPFLLSLESGFLGANNAARTGAAAYGSDRDTDHPLSYIRIASQKSRDRSERADHSSDIWITKDVLVEREPTSR